MSRLIHNILIIAGIIYLYENRAMWVPELVSVTNTVISTVGRAVQSIQLKCIAVDQCGLQWDNVLACVYNMFYNCASHAVGLYTYTHTHCQAHLF